MAAPHLKIPFGHYDRPLAWTHALAVVPALSVAKGWNTENWALDKARMEQTHRIFKPRTEDEVRPKSCLHCEDAPCVTVSHDHLIHELASAAGFALRAPKDAMGCDGPRFVL